MTHFSPSDLDVLLPAACATVVIVYKGILYSLVKWRVFKCSMCLGFWMGILFAILSANAPSDWYHTIGIGWGVIRAGFISSVLSFIIHQAVERIEV